MTCGAIFLGSARDLACWRRRLAFANFSPILLRPQRVLARAEKFVAAIRRNQHAGSRAIPRSE
ncbi:MAG: hypothetical protein QOI49_35 [Verrucomicrobiota bacterium]